jgi:hypothetical protein
LTLGFIQSPGSKSADAHCRAAGSLALAFDAREIGSRGYFLIVIRNNVFFGCG